MAKLNWFLRLKNLASSDPVAKDLWDAIKNADSPEKDKMRKMRQRRMWNRCPNQHLRRLKTKSPHQMRKLRPKPLSYLTMAKWKLKPKLTNLLATGRKQPLL